MRLGDRALGALTLLGAVALFLASRQFSPLPGQKYGAETLPLAISGLTAIVGIWLILQGLATERGAPLADVVEWAREPAAWGRIAATIGLIAAYILMSDWMGFTLASLVLVFALMLLTGTKPLPALVVSVAAVLVVQFAFGKLLMVPLPRGEILSLPW
ncbi:tripartite tricarboxylate transporter TctB family protein [Paracoccus aestuariivivens]|uniref:Tripartite tricarboxylate transporter TctB family protein n=1 Tax=Paracoccus aestuariivivens TaxID=1820333 RepID=A0A6L6JE57_9RHOB|nr:tripartite tricarboxylate transporter TctB family protein [Paracoccus aestuariivivens]MTH78191.1 tripartite tricarboxylate transporter TctB family protein [Paracoccus aestuariivivens]